MRYFLISLAFILFSCGSNPVKGLSALPPDVPTFENPYFSDGSADYVYKANLSVYGHELSGIVIFKKISENTHRVVFTTEFGNRLIDFEVSADDFKINYIVDDLNRKMLINILRDDFRMLLKHEFQISARYETSDAKILMSKSGNNRYLLYVPKSSNRLSELRFTERTKEKIRIGFTPENDTFADRIEIRHTNIKLAIDLNYLKPSTATETP